MYTEQPSWSDRAVKAMWEAQQLCAQVESRCHRQEPCIFTLTTALQLLGVELPWPVEHMIPGAKGQAARCLTPFGEEQAVNRRLGTDLLQVVLPRGSSRPHHKVKADGVRKAYFESDVPLRTVQVCDGVDCTSPVCTWYLFARWLDLEDLVILGCAMLRRTAGMRSHTEEGLPDDGYEESLHRVSLEDFVSYLDMVELVSLEEKRKGLRRHMPKYLERCRCAVSLMLEGTDSSPEMRLVLDLVRHHFPRPEVNYPLVTIDGSHVLMDVAFVKARLDVEYDGRQWHEGRLVEDNERELRIEASGWRVVRVTKQYFSNPNTRRMTLDLLVEHCARQGIHIPADRKPLTLEQVVRRKGMPGPTRR